MDELACLLLDKALSDRRKKDSFHSVHNIPKLRFLPPPVVANNVYIEQMKFDQKFVLTKQQFTHALPNNIA